MRYANIKHKSRGIGIEPQGGKSTMRDDIATIILRCGQSCDFERDTIFAADAIMHSLHELIPDLVWVEHNDVYFNEKFGYNFSTIHMVDEGGFSLFIGDAQVGDGFFFKEKAQAAANTHHRAAFKAMITGEET